MQENVYKSWIKDVDELPSRILTAEDKLDLRVIDTRRSGRGTSLRACVRAKCRHFEHTH